MPNSTPGNRSFTAMQAAAISVLSRPPFVSQSTMREAPAEMAASSVSIAYSASASQPSKKCSAS